MMKFLPKKVLDIFLQYCELTRAYSILISIAPWFLTLCWALIYEPSFVDLFLTLIGIVSLHLGVNLLDDFVDIKKELAQGKTIETIDFGAIKNKGRLILNGSFSFSQVKKIIAILFAIPVLIGIYYCFAIGLPMFAIILMSAILCLFYPFATRYYLGEVVIGLLFGPLLMSGTFMALCGLWSTRILFFSISIAFACIVIVHSHALMDWEYDQKRNKNTLCALFKTKENAIKTLIGLISLAYFNTVFFVLLGWLDKNTLYVFLTLPLAVELIKSMRDYIAVKNVEFKPKWWFGPMEDWQNIEKSGMAFFMYRFYLARNFLFAFCVFAGLACIFG